MDSAYWYFDTFGAAPDVMKRGHTALPDPGPGEASVAIRAVGLNQAECRYLEGTHFPPARFPACIGHEAVGEIVALGPGRDGAPSHWKVGDRVALLPMLVDIAGMGALRTVGIYDQSALVPVPDSYSDNEGAAYWMGILTMAGAMHVAGLEEDTSGGKTVLFTAATGGMGIIALKLARAWGAVSIATTRSPAKARRLARIATHVVELRNPEDLAPSVTNLFPDGIDAVIDPLGGRVVGAAIEALVPGGRYVGYEMIAGGLGTYDIMALLSKDASIHGHTIHRLLQRPELLARLVEIGMAYADALTPLVSESFVFDDAPDAFAALRRCGHVGKIVVTL